MNSDLDPGDILWSKILGYVSDHRFSLEPAESADIRINKQGQTEVFREGYWSIDNKE